MDMGGYGQRLARRGLDLLSRQGDRDADRQVLDAKTTRIQDQARGEDLGVMAGSLVRGGIGVYDERKEAWEQAHPGQEYSALDDLQNLFKEWWT